MVLWGPVLRGDELIGFQRLAAGGLRNCLEVRKRALGSDPRTIRLGKDGRLEAWAEGSGSGSGSGAGSCMVVKSSAGGCP